MRYNAGAWEQEQFEGAFDEMLKNAKWEVVFRDAEKYKVIFARPSELEKLCLHYFASCSSEWPEKCVHDCQCLFNPPYPDAVFCTN